MAQRRSQTYWALPLSPFLQVMFLFTDAHVANEGFLELINNMLTSGMIPALYDDGEKDALVAGIREEVCPPPASLVHFSTHTSHQQVLACATCKKHYRICATSQICLPGNLLYITYSHAKDV